MTDYYRGLQLAYSCIFFKRVLIFGSIPRYSVAKPGLRGQARAESALILSILKVKTAPAASPLRPISEGEG